MDNILNLVGREGGEGATWWKIVEETGSGVTSYYPAVDKFGKEIRWSEFDGSLEEYMKLKVERTRLTVRYLVMGNPVAAENYVREELGCNALAIGPCTLDVYYAQDNPVDN
jgi:hypothetical protein